MTQMSKLGLGRRYAFREARFTARPTTEACLSTVISPGVMGPEYFREVKQLLNSGGPQNPAAMAETMKRHGMIPAPPSSRT
jgi:hypothetical protein